MEGRAMSAVASAPVPAKKLMTADEFLAYCERPENYNRKFELVRGEVVEVSRPTRIHGTVVSNIDRRLGNYAEQTRKGFSVTGDAGIILERGPDTVRGPDVAYFTDVNKFVDLEDGWAETPPVLAVEVKSPHDKDKKLAQKVREYLAAGVKVVWVVNYEERFLTVYRPKQDFIILEETDEIKIPELPEFSCKVADLFRLPGDLPPSAP
jgi:Uma2 family endonuclease